MNKLVEETEIKGQIASRLKSIRQSRSLSLDATAKLTGVSKVMLGQIEREESSPTIAKLWQIASGLDVPFSSFFSTSSEASIESHWIDGLPDKDNMKVKTLFPYCPITKLEVFEIKLVEGFSQLSEPHSEGMIEMVMVVAGVVEILQHGNWVALAEGDSLRFKGDEPHGYRARSASCVIHNIVCYPY